MIFAGEVVQEKNQEKIGLSSAFRLMKDEVRCVLIKGEETIVFATVRDIYERESPLVGRECLKQNV